MRLKITLFKEILAANMVSVSKYLHFKLNARNPGGEAVPWRVSLAVVGLMPVASMLPWLKDPLGKIYSAWNITIDIVWLGHIALLNYGMLCLISTVYFVVVWGGMFRDRSQWTHENVTRWQRISALLCIVPVVLFLFQYLCVDVSATALLASHKTQQLLIQRRFGYTLPPPLIPLQPFTLTASTLGGRCQLLLEQMSFGPFLLCISACIIIAEWRWSNALSSPGVKKNNALTRFVVIPGIILLIIVAGSAPAAMICTYEARILLSSGNYDDALSWLSLANFLNPELEETSAFHIARGQAAYFLSPSRINDDSRVYLAYVYRSHRDYLDAYHQLLPAWQANPTDPWIIDEMTLTLESLVEEARPLNRVPGKTISSDRMALLWLGLLIHVDPANVYAHYTAARINYDLHNGLACTEHMTRVLHLSSNADIASSAYTYMALSDNEAGNYREARDLLLEAVALDPEYRNNVAREELSGLH